MPSFMSGDVEFSGETKSFKPENFKSGYKEIPLTITTSTLAELAKERNLSIRYKSKGKEYYFVICDDTDGEITLLTALGLELFDTKFYGKKTLQVHAVYTFKEFRKLGLAESLYVSIVKSGLLLISDSILFQGAVKLWMKLSNKYKVALVFDDHIGDDDEIEPVHIVQEDYIVSKAKIEKHGYSLYLLYKV